MQSLNRYIELKGITLSYGCRTILKDVDLVLNRGDFMLVYGANGGGKTSLIKIMLGLQKPSEGEVLYYANRAHSVIKGGENIGYLPQKNTLDMSFPMSIREVVESGLIGVGSGMTKAEKQNRVMAMLQDMQLDTLQNRHIGEVSGGQFQRALFARSIISSPTLLVLDEPTSYLDEEFSGKLFATLKQLSPQTTVVAVLHDTSKVLDIANRKIVVENGVVVERF